jgi:hypothetical protein
MIQPSEFRVGNYIIENDSLSSIHSLTDGINIVDHPYGEDKQIIPAISPIPLTEEWLLKCGFLVHPGQTFWFKKSLPEIRIYKYNDVWISDSDTEDHNMIKLPHKVHYVHQLQNLYFSLVGTELTIK